MASPFPLAGNVFRFRRRFITSKTEKDHSFDIFCPPVHVRHNQCGKSVAHQLPLTSVVMNLSARTCSKEAHKESGLDWYRF